MKAAYVLLGVLLIIIKSELLSLSILLILLASFVYWLFSEMADHKY